MTNVNQYSVNIPPELKKRVEAYLRSYPWRYIKGRKMARDMGITKREAGHILRILDFERWSKTRHKSSRNVYIIPEEYRK